MKKYIFILLILSTSVKMQAQQKSNTIVGEYYLTGFMETASGFKLNTDSTFDFFFSYGALDRSGKGTWKQEGSKVIFNNKPGTKGFALINSKVGDDEKFTINITEENQILHSHVYAKIKHRQIEADGLTDKNGVISFPKQVVDSIILFLEFCPDKFFTFINKNIEHNNFEFKFENDITDVFLKSLPFLSIKKMISKDSTHY